MTTIAANRESIACDKQATHASNFKFKVKTKLFEIENPLFYPTRFIIGYAGDLNIVPDILAYLTDVTGQTKQPKQKTTEFLVLTEDKKLFTFITPTKWILIDEPYYAIGSGMHYALGAMSAGATPLEAVKAAAKCDPNTGLGFKQMDFK